MALEAGADSSGLSLPTLDSVDDDEDWDDDLASPGAAETDLF